MCCLVWRARKILGNKGEKKIMSGCKNWKSRMLQSVGNKIMKKNIIIFTSGIFMLVLCLTWAAPRQIGPQPQEFYFKNDLIETPGLFQNKTGVVSSVFNLKSLYKTRLKILLVFMLPQYLI